MTEKQVSKWSALVRRFLLNKFRRKHVMRQISMRKGTCSQCGQCCHLIFRCPFLTGEGKCFIYTHGRPQQCKTFPVDMRDINEVENCGYYFRDA